MTFSAFASLILGLFQLTTITLGLQSWLGIHWSITMLMALCIAPMPILGTAAAIAGAMYAWHWPIYYAVAAFLIPLAFVLWLGKAEETSHNLFHGLRRNRGPKSRHPET